MAPLSLLPCAVCDDEFASVSTLHYHQMCLHTAEELSLAILSLRDLPVNASPSAGDGGSSGNAASPSTDCEDKLLRNGLAKYPQFLNSGGSRKSKVLNSESELGSADNIADTPRNLVNDKENIVQNNAVSKSSGIGPDGKELAVVNVEKNNSVCKERGEPVRSSLWGSIKTLDGKAVDAPVIKIDKKRSSNQLAKSTAVNAGRNASPENCESFSSKVNNGSSVCHDSDSPLEKENVLEKHLKHMNMSSFDDCIELQCSDSDEEETFTTDASCDVKKIEIKEEDIGVPEEDLIAENCLEIECFHSKDVPDKSLGLKSKSLHGKTQKQRSWYKGGNFVPSTNSKVPQGSISISKDIRKSIEGNDVKCFESQGTQSEDREKSSETIHTSTHRANFTDSYVQTDNSFFDEVSNGVVKMLEANNDKAGNDKAKFFKKVSPKKRHILSNFEKISKDKSTKQDSVALKESLMANRPPRIKSEVIVLDGEKRFYCNDCAKTYKKRSHLERHKRVHTGERPFVCPYCDKGFSVRSILNQHIRIHTGEKPYACTICAARFPQKSGLMTHMMLHTGKPFKCDQCDKAFVSNHKLVHHLKSHDGDRPHVCGHCSSAFFTASALSDHKTLHSRNRKHVCNKCNASFVHEVYLKIHLATHLLEADCENEMGGVDAGSVSPNACTSPQSNTEQRSELTLTLDAIDQFCNGETIMMDVV